MVVLVFGSVPPKFEGRYQTPVAKVKPCENDDVHDPHFYSGEKSVMVCHGVEPPLPTEYIICQEAYPNIREFLPCKHKESGGYQCENLEPHTDEHKFGEHTIRHSLAGNGWSCEEIEKSS